MHDSEPEKIHSLLNMVEQKTQEILKSDKDFEIRQAVRWAKRKGLMRKKTDIEVHNELLSKPWLKVNRTIRENLDKQKK